MLIDEKVISILRVEDRVIVEYEVVSTKEVLRREYSETDYAVMMGLEPVQDEVEIEPRVTEEDGVVSLKRLDLEADDTNCHLKSYGNLWVFEVTLPKKGDKKGEHKHEFNHLHLIVKGKAKLTIFNDDGTVRRETVATAPQWLQIPKLTNHQIEALEDNTVGYCIHAVRNQEDEVVSDDFLYSTDPDIRETKEV